MAFLQSLTPQPSTQHFLAPVQSLSTLQVEVLDLLAQVLLPGAGVTRVGQSPGTDPLGPGIENMNETWI